MSHSRLSLSIRHVCVGIACIAGSHALAQGAPETPAALQEIVISSSRIATPLRQIGTSVSVMSAQDIAARGNLSLMDLLRSQPSVSVSNTGGAGQVSTLRIRGEEGYRTLTLIDGIRLADPSGTQVQMQPEHLQSQGISRIEILRGPQGLHYGADAGGVINLSTATGGQTMRSALELSSGAFQTQQVAGTLSGGSERADFSLMGSRFTTDGYNTRDADTVLRDRDGYANTTLHARGGFALTETLQLTLVHRDTAAETQYDGCYSPVDFSTVHDCEAQFEQQASRIAATLSRAGSTHTLAFARTDSERAYDALGSPSFDARGTLTRWEYLGEWHASERARVVAGIDLEKDENNEESRDQQGIYAEVLSDFSDVFFMSAGIRHDENDDFGSHDSVRVSAAHLFPRREGGTLKVRGSVGTGFRAPSPYEASYNRGPFALPPASTTALMEERSQGVELALESFTPTGGHLELVLFDQRIDDAIVFDLASYSGYLQEQGESRSRGVELSASLPLGGQWQVQGNVTLNQTERSDGRARLLRPRQLGNLALSWHSEDDRLHLDGFYRLSRGSKDQVAGTYIALDTVSVTDLSARFRLRDAVEIFARLDNLFDQDAQEVLGYYAAGRAAYAGVRLHL